MKKNKVSISDLDVQPISDEELKAFGEYVAGGSSWWECCNYDSSEWDLVIACQQ